MTNPTIPFWTPDISDAFKENERLKAIRESERLKKKIRDHEENLRKKEEDRKRAEEDRKIEERQKRFKNPTGGMEI